MSMQIPVQQYEERMQIPEGRWPAIFIEPIDIGDTPTEWDSTKKEDSIVMVWGVFVDIDEAGDMAEESMMIFEQRYKKSMFSGGTKKNGETVNPSNLYKHMHEWLGDSINAASFDPESYKGKAAWMEFFHKGGYCRLAAEGAITPYTDSDGNLIPKESWPVVKGYKRLDQSWRKKPRAAKSNPPAHANISSQKLDDDTIPF